MEVQRKLIEAQDMPGALSTGVMHYKTENGLNEINPHYLEFSGRKFKNKAYEGMYVEAGKSYKVSFYASRHI